MQYENQYHVRSDESLVLGEAARLLMSNGFHLVSDQEQVVRMAGPGMRSTNQNPILGASEITLRCSHTRPHTLLVEAELGGVRWMQRFLTWFPTLLFGGLVTLMLAILLIVNWIIPQPIPRDALVGLVILGIAGGLPFQIIRPFAIGKIRARTEEAIDLCVKNADAAVRLPL